MIDALTVESRPLKADLQRFGPHQPGCRALTDSPYGIGGLLAVAMWFELGDGRRVATHGVRVGSGDGRPR